MSDIVKYVTITGQEDEVQSAIHYLSVCRTDVDLRKPTEDNVVFSIDEDTGAYIVECPEYLKTLTFNEVYRHIGYNSSDSFIAYIISRLRQDLPDIGELNIYNELSYVGTLLLNPLSKSEAPAKYLLQHIFYMRALLEYYAVIFHRSGDPTLLNLSHVTTSPTSESHVFGPISEVNESSLKKTHEALLEAGIYVSLRLTQVDMKLREGHALELTADLEQGYVMLTCDEVDAFISLHLP